MYTDTLRPDYYKLAREDIHLLPIWHDYLESLKQKLSAGESVFVTFRDKRRKGSIGKIVKLGTSVHKYCNATSWNIVRTPNDYITITTIEEIHVGFDDRKNLVKCSAYDIQMLLDRPQEAGTVYVFTQNIKPKQEPKIVYDRIGEPVTPGDFVSFVYKSYGHISLKFGTVTRITPKGTVFVQSLNLKDGDRSEELRCNQDNVVIVNDQLMKRLVMAKLAAN